MQSLEYGRTSTCRLKYGKTSASRQELRFRRARATKKRNVFGGAAIIVLVCATVFFASTIVGVIVEKMSPWFFLLALAVFILGSVPLFKAGEYAEIAEDYTEVPTEDMLRFANEFDDANLSHLKETFAEYIERGFLTKGELNEFRNEIRAIRNQAWAHEQAEKWKQKAAEFKQPVGNNE